jgi:hypothetical protein
MIVVAGNERRKPALPNLFFQDHINKLTIEREGDKLGNFGTCLPAGRLGNWEIFFR